MQQVFDEWNTYALKKQLKPRATDLDAMEANSLLKIIGVTGIRRAGKSSLLILLHQKLAKEGKKAGYIDLEDSRIKDARNVLDEILKWFGDTGYLLLDEITNVWDWEGWLSRNHELLKEKLHLIVSSSRKRLAVPSKPLRGRVLTYELYPLSFKEFLQFCGIEFERTTVGLGKIERALHDYLIYGGFPEVVLLSDKTDKVKLLNSYFKDIAGLDVAEMAGETPTTVELFGKYIVETPYFSASKCLNLFKSLGHKIGKQSILNLEKRSQDGYLFFFVPIFSYSIKDRLQYPRKAYLGDTGFMYTVSGKVDMGRLFENAVFLELKRRLPQNHEIHYWKDRRGAETDFVTRKGVRVEELVQVVVEMSDKVRKREVGGLVSCARELGAEEGTIVTKDVEGSETVGGVKIRFIPLWKWLLGGS
ncbi:MAG: ATP-binding protein [Candidatus Hodarchaeaceae archaeon]|nr:ATP-binding protein [Candidatus Hodarchaeaceae archaeon]